ncbi:protein fem-1 homolog C isoform X2 [Sitodiplosis mosellana]|uniref:protein fem-1 homolog C isoform X2 n=1 Tax=Sitodiplosis mosellana TaxID=263140 RepID=UPI0024447FB8|nr:protein fem-1 homolog C isoform X2 [Sitodiplosis mosellana]
MKSNVATRKSHTINLQTNLDVISNDLMLECKLCSTGTRLTKSLRDKIANLPKDARKDIVSRTREGCAPLFVVCKRGNLEIAEFLITICGADIEQRGLFENPEDSTVHLVTPLWCASVSGKLPVVKYLVRVGANINAVSDSGSTSVRSSCFMTNMEIVEFLVENGANIKKPNFNGGTCLINSVQSVQLCSYLISKGADVNAKDIQNKTALHYAIQEHRLETTKLLLDSGADPFAKSKNGDDALQIACLKGAHDIFRHLIERIPYSVERLASANELIGSTYLDEHNETTLAVLHWKEAHEIRSKDSIYRAKEPSVPLRLAYCNVMEFATLSELENISTDVDAMRIQSLLICERVLGIQHTDTLFRLMFRGASYADSLRFQRCIDLWRLALQVRINTHSILHSDTCFTTQALVRLMLDLENKSDEGESFIGSDVPKFEDVYGVFTFLHKNLIEARKLLQIRPVYRKQQENFDRVLKCVTHLIYLLEVTSKTAEEKQIVCESIRSLVKSNIRSACTNDTLLHLCVSRLNIIKSGYFNDGTGMRGIFPNLKVVKLLLECDAEVNAKNESKSTALHVASNPYNYVGEVVRVLLDYGAHLDQPNRAGEHPHYLIAFNSSNTIPIINYTSLKCIVASTIIKNRIHYKNQIPKTLEEFVQLHEP